MLAAARYYPRETRFLRDLRREARVYAVRPGGELVRPLGRDLPAVILFAMRKALLLLAPARRARCRVLRRRRVSVGGRAAAAADLPRSLEGRLEAPGEPGQRDRLLPVVDAEPAGREDRRRLGQRRLGRSRPQLPRQLSLARAAEPGRPRQSARLPGPYSHPALQRGHRRRRAKDSSARVPCFSDPQPVRRIAGLADHSVHGEPGGRPVARALRVATATARCTRSASTSSSRSPTARSCGTSTRRSRGSS